ncbi:hypothetical protein [Ruegeria intermedia]|uniref:hypothetical protein n=1 Tax=Ruegeria intermedia TaxID=996115 RepID=UPI00122D45DA|nr:hypothetical protein [Ruegeria intermedia]
MIAAFQNLTFAHADLAGRASHSAAPMTPALDAFFLLGSGSTLPHATSISAWDRRSVLLGTPAVAIFLPIIEPQIRAAAKRFVIL